jgi:transcriptional regulator GlxA family with amidase domain
MTIAIAIYVFPDVEVLDFAGPYEVFTTASRVHSRKNPGSAEMFRVFTVSREVQLVRARAGLEIKPDFSLTDHPAIDVLVIPGGVITSELNQARVISWITEQAKSSKITASVCTGAFLLGKARLLLHKSATTHWEDIGDLRTALPDTNILENRRWVDEGAVVTSAGISAGIHMSLHLVQRLADRDLAVATARQMEFDWNENA